MTQEESESMESAIRNPQSAIGRILIVDDEEIVHLTLKRLLEHEGYIIDSAYGGVEALDKLDAGYNLLILDIRMPDMDGIEVLREIRKRELDIEVLILTGYATMESATQSMNYGACGYLMKPIENVVEFRDRVREAVHIARLARENKQLYDAIVSGHVDSLTIDGKVYKVPALREESKEIFQRLMEVISDAVIFLDFDGNITFANLNFARMVEDSYQNLLGARFESYTAEEDRDTVVEVFTRLSGGQVAVSIPVQLKTSFGSLLSVIIRASPIYYKMEYRGIAMVISDITEIKTVREKLELLANLVENAQYDMIFIVNSKGQIIECNSLARTSFCYSQSEMLSLNMSALFKSRPDEGWEKIVDSVERDSHWRGDLMAISKDGTEFPVEMTVSRPLSEGDTTGANMICFLRDLTERKQAEEALATSKAYTESIIQNFLDTLIVVDREAKIQTMNPATIHLLDYKEEELIEKPVSIIFAEEEEEEEEEVHRLFQFFHEPKNAEPLRPQDTIRNRELTYKTKDGQLIPMLFNASVLTDEAGNVTGVVAGAKDITELKLAEAELRREKTFSENVIATVPDSLLVLDSDLRIKSANRTFYETFQTEPEKVMGSSIADILHDKDGKLSTELTKLFGTEEMLNNFELPYQSVNLDERIFNITARGMIVAEEEEEEEEEVLVIEDVTERKRAEEEREKMQAQLLQAQKLEAVGTLTAGIAHDFNNLLLVIQSYANLSMMNVDETDPLHENLNEISLTCTSAADLIRKLLLFSRNEPMKLTLFNINSTVDDLLKMLTRLIGEDIAVNTDPQHDLWTVRADERNIEQVIMNLVVNARDAMPKGGKLTIKTENVTLDEDNCRVIPEARAGKFVCLSVADTGVGMDKETIQHIFEPFFSTKDAGAGTGLGLSVVYGIIKQHGGWINVHSKPGQGSTFNVFLPAFSVKPEEETEETISLPELQGSGERILLVEDEEKVREVVTMTLRENGYLVFEVASAEEALELFEREKGEFHMVFSDVVMPDKSGIQLAEELLSRKSELPVLLSSGYVDAKSHGFIIRERGFRLLPKPYALPDLLRAIKETISGYR